MLFLLNSGVDTEESIVYSYTKSFNALAAKLSEDEAQKLSGSILEVIYIYSTFLHMYLLYSLWWM